MTDPRNVAHDKTIRQEKKHKHEEIAPGAEHVPQPGKKPHLHHEEKPRPMAIERTPMPRSVPVLNCSPGRR